MLQEELGRMIETFGVENKAVANGKKKAVAWFVSNCASESGREIYVDKLKKYIQVPML
jgi:hypothetical protein